MTLLAWWPTGCSKARVAAEGPARSLAVAHVGADGGGAGNRAFANKPKKTCWGQRVGDKGKDVPQVSNLSP